MDLSWLLDKTRWEIIEAIAKRPSQMSALAKKIGTSIANVSQHIKLLEAYGFLSAKIESAEGKPGKPATTYSLRKEATYIVSMRDGLAGKKALDLKDPFQAMLSNVLMLDNADDQYVIHKFIYLNEEILKKCQAINYLRSETGKVELLLVTENLEDVRKNLSTAKVKDSKGKDWEVACWTQSPDEIENGLKENDEYYTDLVKSFRVIYDRDNMMLRWRR